MLELRVQSYSETLLRFPMNLASSFTLAVDAEHFIVLTNANPKPSFVLAEFKIRRRGHNFFIRDVH